MKVIESLLQLLKVYGFTALFSVKTEVL